MNFLEHARLPPTAPHEVLPPREEHLSRTSVLALVSSFLLILQLTPSSLRMRNYPFFPLILIPPKCLQKHVLHLHSQDPQEPPNKMVLSEGASELPCAVPTRQMTLKDTSSFAKVVFRLKLLSFWSLISPHRERERTAWSGGWLSYFQFAYTKRAGWRHRLNVLIWNTVKKQVSNTPPNLVLLGWVH